MAEPKIRFRRDNGSCFPVWKEYSISDLFIKIVAKNKNCENTNVITNSAEFGLISQSDYFDKDIAVKGKTDNYTIIQTGDFVYNPRKSSYAPMGPFNCYRLKEDGIVSPLYSCLRPKGILKPEYLLWYFQTDKWYGYVNDHGAQNGARHDRVGMTDKILMGIPVTAPCSEEQQKIADFLSSVDEVIATSEQEVANLEMQKKAVMKKVFSQEVRFKKDDGSDFPAWEIMSVISCCKEFCDGDWIESKDQSENGIRLIQTGNVGNGIFIEKEARKRNISLDTFKRLRCVEIYYGDILISRLPDPAGRACIVPNLNGRMITAVDCSIVRPFDNKLIKEYLIQFYQSSFHFKYVNSLLAGGTRQRISRGNLEEEMIFVPCLEEQKLIADFLSSFDEAILSAKKELELWKQLKKGLLQQMFC